MFRSLLVFSCVLIACVSGIVVPGLSQEKKDAKAADFEVHEWGVFTMPRGAAWQMQDMVAEWSTFPEFFNGIWPKKNLAYRGAVRKPVVFFHSREKRVVQMQVQFATGRPLIWWPNAEYPNNGGDWFRPNADALGGLPPESALLFRLHLNDDDAHQHEVPKDHWIRDLRKVKSSSVTTDGSYGKFRHPRAKESFVYYDGLMKATKTPTVKRIQNGIEISTNLEHHCLDLMVIERNEGKLSISSKPIKKIKKGSQSFRVELKSIDEKDIESFVKSLHSILVDAGLNDDEAQSLIDVWNQGLFHQSGLTLFYRIDRDTYDKWLPIRLWPQPRKIQRVGLVVHDHLEPELENRVERLVEKLGSLDFKTRDQADRDLREIGGAAFEFIEKAAKGSSPEIRARCYKILKQKELIKKAAELAKQFKK